ncbi:MAG: hypothetical protein LBU17_02585 [Treponema sp.]|nr:hypothetical protein [Treponema sp.]
MDQVGYVEDTKRDIARNALIEGATLEFVIKITGLPLETVEKIAHEIKQENGNPWIPR